MQALQMIKLAITMVVPLCKQNNQPCLHYGLDNDHLLWHKCLYEQAPPHQAR